ncbi:hypothetical protein PHMEG_0007144 [Phytophthora megakarya]|uniref:Uncharacterized protein n=1 Tax=Phytophthora megakarya TaxID=4795 RepID=A0A225WM18_9STRA|nr:hypothetical protein PHMEG_0007144 [Phytophthora megakarya]
MAIIVSDTQENVVMDSCASTGGCQRQLQSQHVPEFVPTHEWQDILPDQAIPPQRVHLLSCTPLLTTARVRANFDENASGWNTTLVPVRRKRTAVSTDRRSTNAAAPPMFEPTAEWKEILPNQVLPAVRQLDCSQLFRTGCVLLVQLT